MKRTKPKTAQPEPVLEPVITVQLLRSYKACWPQVKKFKRTFGTAVVPTKELLLKHRDRFSINWLLSKLDYMAYCVCMSSLHAERERIEALPSYHIASVRRKHKLELLHDLDKPEGLSDRRWEKWFKEVHDSIWKEFEVSVAAHKEKYRDIEATAVLKYLCEALMSNKCHRIKQ